MSTKELKEISSDKVNNIYKKGQTIFYQGNKAQGLYCIFKGKVKIHNHNKDGKEQIIRLAKKSEVLGYRSIIGNEPYSATATALEDCVICYLSKENFVEAISNNGNLVNQVAKLLSSDLVKSEQKIINLKKRTVEERISETLLILKEKFGVQLDGKTLDVTLSRKEIGEMAGVSVESTIRTLSNLNKSKVIKLKGKAIQILELAELINRSNIND